MDDYRKFMGVSSSDDEDDVFYKYKKRLRTCKNDHEKAMVKKIYKLYISKNTIKKETPQIRETPEVKIKTRPKPEETRYDPEYFSQRNIFTGRSFDIEKFNNFFENSKKDDTNTVTGKTYENIDVFDFDQVDNYQPIIEYGGVVINDPRVDTDITGIGINIEPISSMTNEDIEKKMSHRRKNVIENNKNFIPTTGHCNVEDYMNHKEKLLRRDLDEKKNIILKNLHLFNGGTDERQVLDYNEDNLVRDLTRGPFE